MSFPRYPSYRDSGVEWLGEVPEHWQVMPLKRDIEFVTSGARGWAENYADDGDLFIRIGNLTRDTIRLDLSDIQRVTVPDSAEVARTQVQSGDVLFSITAYLGSVAVVPSGLGRAFVSQHVALARPHGNRLRPEWIAYVTASHVGKTCLEMLGYGGTKVQLSLGDVANLLVTVPPLYEQEALVRFLDRETAKIDALVAEQENLIGLLKEKRQAVISHAVTKGLDPSVPMKDSGVEWLGEVPEHWEVAALNYRFEVLLGKMLDEKRITGNHLAPYLRNVDVQWDRINVDELPQMDFEGDDIERYALRAGDLLVCEGGEVGRAAIWTGALDECYYQKALHRLRPREPLRDVSRFQFYLLNVAAMLGIFTGGQGKATIAHLTAESLRRYRFPYPPCAEQIQIVHVLDEESKKFDALVAEAQSAIALLQERRTALISAAVTGQIDVRQAMPIA